LGRAVSSIVTLAVIVYLCVVISGFFLKGDPAAYLPAGFPGNQILRDWAVVLQQQLAPAAGPVAPAVGACGPFSVSILGPENRIPLSLELVDRSGSASQRLAAVLDTGAGETTLPEPALRSIGATPGRQVRISGVVPGATVIGHEFRIDGSQLRVLDNGQYVPLANGPLTVLGDPSGTALIGPDVVKAGLGVQISGSTVQLTPPCAT
jgi:hypothetical protein